MSPPPAPSPGWYPDPAQPGWQRYWDGQRWTEHSASPLAAPPGGLPVPRSRRSAQLAMIAHLSSLLSIFGAGLIFLGPLAMYLLKMENDPFVDAHVNESLNFSLSVTLYAVVGIVATFILIFVLIGVLLIPVLLAGAVAWFVLVLRAAMAAKRGELVRYPLTIRFVG